MTGLAVDGTKKLEPHEPEFLQFLEFCPNRTTYMYRMNGHESPLPNGTHGCIAIGLSGKPRTQRG